MKINGIKALDYQCQGDSLTLVLTETTFDAVSNLNTEGLAIYLTAAASFFTRSSPH